MSPRGEAAPSLDSLEMDPILIMSSERSGSNLVRRMLAAHPELSAPPPPHLWDLLLPMLPRYGPLDHGERWRDLVSDAIALTQVKSSHTCWKHALTVDEVAPRARRKNLSGLIGAMYEGYAAREGKKRWVCKENNLFQHAFRILDVYPGTRGTDTCITTFHLNQEDFLEGESQQ